MMQELVSQIKKMARDEVEGAHTALPAEIVSYDASKGLAVVQPKAKFKKPNGETIDFPEIDGVPVLFPQNKDFSIAFPVKPGDGCLIIFSDQSLDFWLYGKETDTELKHDLSNALAIPNINTKGNPDMVTACDEDAVVIRAGESKAKIKTDEILLDGSVKIEARVGGTVMVIKADGVFITGNFTVSGGIVNLN